MAVFLVIGSLALGSILAKKNGLIEERGVLGGPAAQPSNLLSRAEGAELAGPAILDAHNDVALLDQNAPSDLASYSPLAMEGAASLGNAVLQDTGAPVGPAFDRSGMVSYTVQKGDSLSKIASYFGISIDTVLGANPGLKANTLKIGQSLKILPTSGVVYQAKSGDTLAIVADAFGVSQEKILKFNQAVNFASLDPGESIIIPGGKSSALLAAGASLPNYSSEFIMPANGYNWGILHHYNAVDIANSCGTPVVASAEGLVVPDDSIPNTLGGWNDGYGNFVLIEHPFGGNVETRYAHLQSISVSIGDYVKQGQVIGLMGETGDATGCHVHFEVIGAQNPFAKK